MLFLFIVICALYSAVTCGTSCLKVELREILRFLKRCSDARPFIYKIVGDYSNVIVPMFVYINRTRPANIWDIFLPEK